MTKLPGMFHPYRARYFRVLAEIRPAFQPGGVEEFLSDLSIEFTSSSRESAILAGEMFRTYLERSARSSTKTRRPSPRVVADFLIGAHAMVTADRLLARDRGCYRDYFKQLTLLEP
jgi:predicted nucleic acid-binding protein